MTEQFRGGPLEDGRVSQVHSLILHMRGDGRYSVGWYEQVYENGVPLGVFEWHSREQPDGEYSEA